jgi:alpha-1,6-mannosyltransferase
VILTTLNATVVALRRGEATLPIAGFAGAVVLVLATSGIPGRAAMLLALALTGMGVVVLAWLAMWRQHAEMSVKRLYCTAAAWGLPLLVARPLFSGDVYGYLAYGLTAAKGFNPYQFGPATALGADSPVTQAVSHYWQDTPSPYGPVSVAIFRAIAFFAGQNVPATVLANRFVELVGVVLIAWALPRLARRVGVRPATAVWLGLLNPLLLWHLVAGAHNDGLMLGLVLAGLEVGLSGLSRPGRLLLGVVLVMIAANIKIVALAAVCCLGAALARRWGGTLGRGLLVALALSGGFAVISLVIAGVTGLGLGWVFSVSGATQVHSWLAPTNQLGFLLGALAGGGFTDTAITACVVIGGVLGAAVVIGLLWSVLRGRRDPVVGLGLVFAVMLVSGPIVQPWYLLWAILPLAASTRTDRARRTIAAISAAVAVLIPPSTVAVPALVEGYLGAVGLLTLIVAAYRARIAYPVGCDLSEMSEHDVDR